MRKGFTLKNLLLSSKIQLQLTPEFQRIKIDFKNVVLTFL